jgi:predicted porin
MNTGKLPGNGALFGRQAYVGIDNPRFGRVTIGRQYDLNLESVGPLTAAARVSAGLGAHAGDVDDLWVTYNTTNAIKYLSPTIGGVTVGALYRFGGVARDFSNSQLYNFSISYVGGPVTAAASFVRVNDPGVAIYGAATSPAANSTWANPVATPIFGGFASARRLQVAAAGVVYAIGPVSAGLIYSNTKFEDVVPTSSMPLSGTFIFNSYEANVSWIVTPSIFLGAAFDYASDHGSHYNTVSLGAKYFRSKRTFFYMASSYMHASGVNSFGKPAVANNYLTTTSTSPNQTTVIVGIRHDF